MNIAGILLIAVAIGLFAAEALTSGYVLFAAAGLIALILGGILLFDFAVAPWVTGFLLALILILSLTATILIARRVAAAHHQKIATGSEELIGLTAKVRSPLKPTGTVFIEGEIWTAVLPEGTAAIGDTVTVTAVDGLNLRVTK
ncbi:MAG: NfeD family protein [Dehalogenimonas sp.]|uniref:NfeD family protein n=1 Tax=Candidatus Dehalogenimonas loeffleri TaxID=3127115 RepID=A0ABZ2J3D3_9CHLR|nr:NfeD family protein [Dehalogenimonas sp.]